MEKESRKASDIFSVYPNLKTLLANSPLYRESILAEIDFPHQPFHTLQVFQYTVFLGSLLNMTPRELEIAIGGALMHDSGYLAVEAGAIEPEGHHISGYMRTLDLCKDTEIKVEVANTVFYHAEDVLPKDAPLYIRVVRDADRAAGMGWAGVTRDAYYLGFRHPVFTQRSSRQIIEDEKIWDPRPPILKTYGKKVKSFCLKYVLPYLVENTLGDQMIRKCVTHTHRFYGLKGLDGNWNIEPMSSEAQTLFRNQIRATLNFGKKLCGQI